MANLSKGPYGLGHYISTILMVKSAFEELKAYIKSIGESEKELKSHPPRPVYFSYTVLEVNLPDYKNKIEVVDKEYDSMGYLIAIKRWFEPISQIIDYTTNVVAEEK